MKIFIQLILVLLSWLPLHASLVLSQPNHGETAFSEFTTHINDYAKVTEKNLRLTGDAADNMKLVLGKTGEHLAQITDKGLIRLKNSVIPPIFTVLLDMGQLPVKFGDEFLEAEVKVVKYGDEVGVVVEEVNDFIPTLLNKVDNVIDDVGNTSLQVADVTDEIVKCSNSISDAAKKFWANHEVNCTKYLRETYGNTNVGRQITVDITLTNGQVVTCRVDNLVKQGSTYKIIDAKSSIINNLGTKNVDDLISQYATINQKTFYEALKNGQVQSIKPRGQRAVDYFDVPTQADLFNINIGNSIDFLVNDVATNGYNIYKKTFSF
jgi:hypothetical protein